MLNCFVYEGYLVLLPSIEPLERHECRVQIEADHLTCDRRKHPIHFHVFKLCMMIVRFCRKEGEQSCYRTGEQCQPGTELHGDIDALRRRRLSAGRRFRTPKALFDEHSDVAAVEENLLFLARVEIVSNDEALDVTRQRVPYRLPLRATQTRDMRYKCNQVAGDSCVLYTCVATGCAADTGTRRGIQTSQKACMLANRK